ncbi:MAG TPA: RloB family protein [Planctomycetota bacterium]|nr:RloB family protein [Planctomycetota bacterium]HRU52576.1 RloB family protein [Planctomycetota bacterium]
MTLIRTRPSGKLRYRKIFILAVEGSKTEQEYFEIFNDKKSLIKIDCLKSNKESSPLQVLARMKKRLKKEDLKKSDEAWLVVDKDQWTDEQLSQLYQWSKQSDNYGFALSNPKFEFWLLLHFEDGKKVCDSKSCSQKLKLHLPNYNKSIDMNKISEIMIDKAIQRAKQRDTPPCCDWPHTIGTTVYKLVENILKSCKNQENKNTEQTKKEKSQSKRKKIKK